MKLKEMRGSKENVEDKTRKFEGEGGSKRRFKRLTINELQEMKSKGLCFRCDE